MITVKKHLTVNGHVETHDFRQFESLIDAVEHIGQDRMLIFINSAILNHDRNQLRKHRIKNDKLELDLYKQQKRFSYL